MGYNLHRPSSIPETTQNRKNSNKLRLKLKQNKRNKTVICVHSVKQQPNALSVLTLEPESYETGYRKRKKKSNDGNVI